MTLYDINDDKLTPSEIEFDRESKLQRLTENNLEELFNLQFVDTEFEYKRLRIDTLAFNPETNSFVIIEYKNKLEYSVIDQGFSYLALLLNNKYYFIKKYNELTGLNLQLDDFDFSKNEKNSNYCNTISTCVNALFNSKRILNSSYISKILSKWVDNIFGKNQLPKKKEDYLESYNIYNKLAYEQKVDLEKKIMKNYELYKNGKISEKKYKEKIREKICYILNFGINPKQILVESNEYEGKIKSFDLVYKSHKTSENKYIYFNNIRNDSY